MILGVDPGTRDLGWVLRSGGVFMKGGIIRARSMEQMLRSLGGLPDVPVSALTVERPQLYGIRDRSDPNKIGQLLVVAGAVAARYPNAKLRLPFPRDWKGQVPKEIHHGRILRGLDAVSAARLDVLLATMPDSVGHNVLDALGLTIWTETLR